jgi:hypothetical protein
MTVRLPESNTAVIERNRVWEGAFETEPWEAAWAKEAVFFVRALEVSGPIDGSSARLQISPDGIHWCYEGTSVDLPTGPDAVTFARASHFGGWLRLVGELPPNVRIKVIVYLTLKA